MPATVLPANTHHDKSWVQKTIRKRWNDIFQAGSTISLIERWSDENYNPLAIPVKQYDAERNYIVVAELTGYESTDVHVDVRRGCLIILATHYGDAGEHYVEVPLPAGVNQRVVKLEFRGGILTASFRKTGLALAEAAFRLALAKLSY